MIPRLLALAFILILPTLASAQKMQPRRIIDVHMHDYSTNHLSDEVFAYSGFSLQMDLSVLHRKYPRSSHEFVPRDGGRAISASDNPRQLDDALRVGTGDYRMRFTADESQDGLYYVQAEIDRGLLRRLRLSFEKPLEFMNKGSKAKFEEQHPRCEEMKAALVRSYGRPSSTGSSWEEQLQNISSSWVKSPEVLTLNCGRYHKRKKIFAMELILKRVL
jgi:hypothetical protein